MERTAKTLLQHVGLQVPEQVAVATTTIRTAPSRMPREKDFARVRLRQLLERTWDGVFPERCRAYLYLVIASLEGRRPVRFTNSMATEIGLKRQNKMRALRWLEAAGLISVAWKGRHVPVITLITLPDQIDVN
jgi:hypothetical protein